VREMPHVVDIGLPRLDEEQIDALAEDCEQEITRFILHEIPSKSIEDMTVTCILEFEQQLDLSIEIEITQKYDSGHVLESVIERASQYGYDWFEKRLLELKGD